MRKLIPGLLLIIAGLVPSIAAQQPPAPVAGAFNVPPPRAAVSGVVLRSTTGDPIARATVTLTRVGGQGGQGGRGGGPQAPQAQAGPQAQQQPTTFSATTDDQGKFLFKDLDEGPYRIVAARNGFTRQEYGQRSFNRPGTVVNISAGQQLADISFRLMPASTISGRVLDSFGEPLPGITVQALRSTYDATGKRTLQSAGSARTNDLGEYRVYWINPGRYFVSANSARSAIDLITANASQAAAQSQNQAQSQAASQAASIFGGPVGTPNEVPDSSFGLTYYPGSTDVSRAIGLDLQPGRETRADFTMTRTQRVRVTGRVMDVTTGRPPQNATVSINSRDASASSPLDALVGMDLSQGNRYNPATGEFVVQNVASGAYWLQVMTQGQPATPPNVQPNPTEALAMLSSINIARIPVDVGGADVTGLVLNVSPGISVPGQIRIEGVQANTNDLQRISVSLQSTSGGFSILTMLQAGGVRPAADGTFLIPRITFGDYKLVVNGVGPNLYVKEGRLGRVDALNGATITEGLNASLEIVLRPNPGQITGTVVDSTLKPVSGVQAVLVPDQARSRQDLYRTAATDQSGRFTLRGITPGDYRIFAWEDIEPFAYFDPDVLRQYEAAGKLVHIQESSAEVSEIRIIPAGTP